jgi:hypothetical protein
MKKSLSQNERETTKIIIDSIDAEEVFSLDPTLSFTSLILSGYVSVTAEVLESWLSE